MRRAGRSTATTIPFAAAPAKRVPAVGDHVLVKAGPFARMKGTVARVVSPTELAVAVSIFGRATEVMLAVGDVDLEGP